MTLTPSIIIGIALALGPAIAVACVSIGVFGYKPEKMRAIRAAEADELQSVTVEEVRAIVVGRPEKFRHDRMDRHYSYLGIHVAAWCYAWCVFAGASLTSNVTEMNGSTRLMMAACFMVGSTLALSGSAMGLHAGRFSLLRGIHDNIASARLSDDIRMPYTFGAIGMFCMIISCGIYAWTSFASTTGSLGGWLTLCGGAMASVALMVEFIRRIRIYVLVRARVINEAVAIIVQRGGGHVDN